MECSGLHFIFPLPPFCSALCPARLKSIDGLPYLQSPTGLSQREAQNVNWRRKSRCFYSALPCPPPPPDYGDGSGPALFSAASALSPAMCLSSVCTAPISLRHSSLHSPLGWTEWQLWAVSSPFLIQQHIIKLSSVDSGRDNYLLQEPLTVGVTTTRDNSPSIPSKQEKGRGSLVYSITAENASLTGKPTLVLCSLQWHHCHSNTPGSTGQRSGGGSDWHLVTKATILFIKMWGGTAIPDCLGKCDQGECNI